MKARETFSRRIKGLRITKAGASDSKRLLPLFLQYLHFYNVRKARAEARLFLWNRLKAKESVVFLALAGRRVVGFAQLYPTFSSLSLQRFWIFSDLYVTKRARRSGVAKALMRRAEALAIATKSQGLITPGFGSISHNGSFATLLHPLDNRVESCTCMPDSVRLRDKA